MILSVTGCFWLSFWIQYSSYEDLLVFFKLTRFLGLFVKAVTDNLLSNNVFDFYHLLKNKS